MSKTNDPMWDDLKTVLAVVRHGTLAGAGQVLGVNYTTVARRVARAEAALDQILFERLPEGYRPTAAAQLIVEHAAQMEHSSDRLLRQLSGQDQRLTGPLVVTAPQLLIAHCMAPALQQFCQSHAEIQLRLRASNALLDLDRREADIAIRISNSPGDSLKGLRLAGQHTAGFASPEYAAQMMAEPDRPIDWLIYEGHGKLPEYVRKTSKNSRIHMMFDDMVAMAWAAKSGLGVIRTPIFVGRAFGLVQVPVLPPEPYLDIWIVAHPDVWSSAKVQVFRDVVVPFFKMKRAQFVAAP